ncbi:uncharacterized protein DNG_09965 [Cephalotrichum gorgonifer]|uniref:Uncharacterized protein n=1 Tax=Cephalotrichum gorgonifer TaxID=2041049 RepID=A0AAE8N6Q3_9PEZI|nr:uncharacterized protein DNG_09965 [Cephalotrichum gorgonifer]
MRFENFFAASFLVLGAAAADTWCYYCHDDLGDESGKGQYPTYNCGDKCGYKYYHTSNDMKCWRSDHGMNDCIKGCCADAKNCVY